ncbi:hypothetical protein [Nostoc sp.]
MTIGDRKQRLHECILWNCTFVKYIITSVNAIAPQKTLQLHSNNFSEET